MDTTRSYITLIVSVLLMMGAWGVFAWGYFELQSERELAIEKLTEAERNLAVNENINQVKNALRDSKDERAQLHSIIDGKDAIAILGLLERIGKDIGVPVKVDSVAAEPKRNTEPRMVRIRSQATGSFEKLHQLLAVLETAPLGSEVNMIEFSKNPDGWKLVTEMRILAHIDD